ncbi:glycerol-3-phosphate dehydrogenase [Yamadazyma tenuis]|uniref:Glycerol-3-phosphate dehydrogenase [NAD(+)] n=1 Tax=Candida tenuis (strain ATCC 10573 / BCRC 21748 / CBS 615 / JCM 9827 / NBRC 10315 / NRRL Y-1498 / VKM Y-70) TaxID=590646 RepID=G3AZ97_CANTC|nr:NAD-dependent glycerol-3-phosphate dehydrogenase [Yamadazyma tenuis ATCC 10573]EGV66043.1 NAD-dependent glycerol-3-phosphate dehydrogenase [Yamadazyma tenuis ATCC 10573]WEJ95615.1 glycerol-3-phosphate dehydrogenase [Yamadazyma tenuis]
MTTTPIKIVTPFRIAIIGSGNWGTAVAKLVAENTRDKPEIFQKSVNMWVFEEDINGEKLTDIINTKHENVKYLPGIQLPENLIANPDVVDTVKNADLLVFNIPHQFLPRVCKQLVGQVKPSVRAISCLKGLEVTQEGCKLLSQSITDTLGIHCGVLSGANIANEVAKEKWSETSIAYDLPKDFKGDGLDINEYVLREAFHRSYFHVNVIKDVVGASIAGALKNVVAIAAGLVEGAGWGDNAKAAVMRIGIKETIKFASYYEKFGIKTSLPPQATTFTEESAGVADLITTCSGGRNVRVARYMVEHGVSAWEAEKTLLNGQSSQGILTAKEVHELLENYKLQDEFPLFEATYKVIYENLDVNELPTLLEA